MIGSNKFKRSLSALLVFTAFCSSCGTNDGKNATIKTVIYGDPVTLDPQTSVSDSSVGIIANVFEGLFAFDENGVIVPAMAESYSVSDDGLTWDFILKDDVMWYDGEDFSAPCTAHDYVFAFRRLISPATKSTRAAEYFCIKNAEKLNSGEMSNIDLLGVEAVSDYELKITLEEQRSDFIAKLASPPAMPCNEEYFDKTEGRYGLYEDCLASNGPFYLYSWRYDPWSDEGNYIVLKKNKLNSTAENEVYPYSLTFFIDIDGFNSFKNSEIHCYASQNSVECAALDSCTHREYETLSCGLVFNGDGVFGNTSLRTALGACARKQLQAAKIPISDAIVPSSAYIGEVNYRQAAGEMTHQSFLDSDLEERYYKALGEVGAENFSGLKLIMPKNADVHEKISTILQGWQKNFGFYCSVSEYDSADYLAALRSGDYDIAAICLNGGGNGAASYIDYFSSDTANVICGADSPKLQHIIRSIGSCANDKLSVQYCKEAEQLILDMYYFVPICFMSENVYFAKGVSGVGYDPYHGTFLFRTALRAK